MEVEDWTTPIGVGDLHIIEVRWGTSDWFVEYDDGRRYKIDNDSPAFAAELAITVFHTDSESIYQVSFDNAGAFRLLDEHGLADVWNSTNVASNCMKIRQHGWATESPLSFANCSTDGWSYLITTSDECVEIVSPDDPEIKYIKKINAVRRHTGNR